MNLNTRRLIAVLVVIALSILFGLAAWALTASPTVTVIFVVLGALAGIFVFMAQQRGSF